MLKIGLGAHFPRPHREVFFIVVASSFKLSKSFKVAFPLVILVSSSSKRLFPIRQGVHLPQDSSTVN